MEKYWKDTELEGIYVKRCKCGARPYYDRIAIYPTPQWIKCNCGRTGKSDLEKQVAINNWNNDKLELLGVDEAPELIKTLEEIKDTTDPVFILQETGAFPPTDGISGRLLGVDEAPDTFSVDVCMRGGKWCPMFRIGNQSFTLSACEDKESAQFMAGLLSRALKNIYNTNLNHAN